MNEADFVAYLQENFPFSYGKGIGDDTSVVGQGKSNQLITTDVLIEDVHFKLDYFNMEELALKALAVNISDIAAMGGQPCYFYLGLGLPHSFGRDTLFNFFKGIKKWCERWHVELAGGDFSASPVVVISITMVGYSQNPIYRHNANTGDLVAISGKTGESAIGLQFLLKGLYNEYFIDKHKSVTPGIETGQILSRYVNAMIDVSDGLVIDLKRILTASKKGARLDYENIPVSNEIKEICQVHNWSEYQMVLAGGEDYILLFTISQESHLKLKKDYPQLEYSVIGKIIDGSAKLIIKHWGKTVKISQKGYDHFVLK